jgi:hypothetical protein
VEPNSSCQNRLNEAGLAALWMSTIDVDRLCSGRPGLVSGRDRYG